MNQYAWYASIKKPSWAPPPSVFGPVWTVLYIIIGVSFGYVGYLYWTNYFGFIIALPFALNLLFNVLFSPIQFSIRSHWLAAVDIILTLATLIWALVVIYPVVPWVALANIPYLLWVSFATVLQLRITALNT
jgi:tryptophan-rich sensory protein